MQCKNRPLQTGGEQRVAGMMAVGGKSEGWKGWVGCLNVTGSEVR